MILCEFCKNIRVVTLLSCKTVCVQTEIRFLLFWMQKCVLLPDILKLRFLFDCNRLVKVTYNKINNLLKPVTFTIRQPFKVTDMLLMLLWSVLLILLVWYLLIRRPSGAPPGPPVYVPILGNLVDFNQQNMLDKFKEYRKKYGDVFSLKLGSRLVVVINGYDAMREALVNFGDVFSSRPDIFSPSELAQGLGIVSSSGNLWREHRHFAMTTIKNLGLNDGTLEQYMLTEIDYLTLEIQGTKGDPFKITDLVLMSISNIMCRLMFGQRFDYSDSKFIKIVQSFNENLELSALSGALNFLPFLNYIPGDPCKIKVIKENQCIIDQFLFEFIQGHKETYEEDHTRDYIDAFLKKKYRERNLTSSTFSEEQLLRCISDLFIAGTHTTSTSIQWGLLFLITHSDVQTKMRYEMDKVLGTSRWPRYENRHSLPFCQAVVSEVLRCGNIAPITLPHGVNYDIEFRGYKIHQNAILFLNQDSVLSDPLIFDQPELFNPSRFIDNNGALMREEKIVSFSLGRRACLGEAVARMELFLYLTHLVKRFEFLPEDVNECPNMNGILGINRTPTPYRLKAVRLI
ncbi:hypothetical protein KUTeg_024267 [Tegillarca granosa]|uniref:Unspecific monooxygenase n=1 Tax=Tegillarca granosa TaxID=220873 RepID=A0ABQ9DZW7_TEGGR|nr:hypothetical protein KUTeg_024267 [Tegillarca granosa]